VCEHSTVHSPERKFCEYSSLRKYFRFEPEQRTYYSL
jgi:hypothetical protein